MSEVPRILVVDDIHRNRKILKDRLESGGYTVIEAGDGVEALERIANDAPDLVFLDIIMRMPTEGVWVSEEIAADPELRSIPVVILTSIVDSEYAGHFPTDRPLHAHLFLDKPVPLRKILEVANRYVDQPASLAS